MAKPTNETAERIKERLLSHALTMVDEWAADALDSDDPKHKKEFVEMALKSNGAYSKEDAGAHLPVFNITIGANGTVVAQAAPVPLVEEVVPEALPAPGEPTDAEIEASLAIFDLPLTPIG